MLIRPQSSSDSAGVVRAAPPHHDLCGSDEHSLRTRQAPRAQSCAATALSCDAPLGTPLFVAAGAASHGTGLAMFALGLSPNHYRSAFGRNPSHHPKRQPGPIQESSLDFGYWGVGLSVAVTRTASTRDSFVRCSPVSDSAVRSWLDKSSMVAQTVMNHSSSRRFDPIVNRGHRFNVATNPPNETASGIVVTHRQRGRTIQLLLTSFLLSYLVIHNRSGYLNKGNYPK